MNTSGHVAAQRANGLACRWLADENNAIHRWKKLKNGETGRKNSVGIDEQRLLGSWRVRHPSI